MRILVATDSIGSLASQQAGEVLGSGWPRAQVHVVPVGVAGAGFVRAVADLLGVRCRTAAVATAVTTTAYDAATAALLVETAPSSSSGLPFVASSAPIGVALDELLGRSSFRRVYLDLAGADVHDAGAGLLAALGATADVPLDAGVAGLDGLTVLDATPARQRLAGIELVGVVPADQLARPLLGLRGITSRRGRESGLDAAVLLQTDAALDRFAALLAPELAAAPGAGACGGLGLAVLALGGRLSTGPAVNLTSPTGDGWTGIDLVVTGCSVFDFAARGGGVVAAAAEAAAEVLAPCLVVAGEVLIGGREMRTMGVEAAYPVRESTAVSSAGADVTAAELAATARRVGRSWSW